MTNQEVEQALTRELRSGERLLWAGRPAQRIVFPPATFVLVASVCAGFIILWRMIPAMDGGPRSATAWMVPYALFGFTSIALSVILDAVARQRRGYGLTDERIVILDGQRVVYSLGLRRLEGVSLTESADGSGTITFSVPKDMAPRTRSDRRIPPAFEGITNARTIHDQILQAQAALVRPR